MAKNHIEKKDTGDDISKNTSVYFNKARDLLSDLSRTLLLAKSTLPPDKWYKYQIKSLNTFEAKSKLIINQTYKSVSKDLKSADKEIINNKQADSTLKTLKKGFNNLYEQAIDQHKQSYLSVYQNVIHSNVSDNLYQMIADRVSQNTNLGYHVTQSGKTYHWESWMEMKVRTDIQQDIATNMVEAGDDSGVVFYTTSCYGNCAPDHADYQGKIYVTENWESVAPKDKKEAISDYIQAHDVKTIQEVMNNYPWLTTRPNCRHYFMPMPIDEVLGCSTNKDVEKLRDKYGLNFAGAYKPEKYEALQEQRYNERRIRDVRANYLAQKDIYNKLPLNNAKDANIMVEEKAKLDNLKSKLATEQAYQRNLVNNGITRKGQEIDNSYLFRSYDREKYYSKNPDVEEKRDEYISNFQNNIKNVHNETKNDNVVKIKKWPTDEDFKNDGMSDEQLEAFKVYTANNDEPTSCHKLSGLLWTNGDMTEEQKQAYDYLHEGILNSKYEASKGQVLYHGTGMSFNQFAEKYFAKDGTPGQYTWKGFFSTTDHIDSALYYANDGYFSRDDKTDTSPQVIFRLFCNNNKYVPLEGITRTNGDYEVLMMNSVKITSKKELKDFDIKGKKFIIVDVEVEDNE